MIPFQKGVKFVTAIRKKKDEKVIFVEQRLSRALEDYKLWVKAFQKDEKGAADALRTIEEKGFDKVQIPSFRDAFQLWKKEKKSRKAAVSRSKRKTHKYTDQERRKLHRDLKRALDHEETKMLIKIAKEQNSSEN
jgi:hypothetical protein